MTAEAEAIRDLVAALAEIDRDPTVATGYATTPEAENAIELAVAGTDHAIVRFTVPRSVVERAGVVGRDDAVASVFIKDVLDGLCVEFASASETTFTFATRAMDIADVEQIIAGWEAER